MILVASDTLAVRCAELLALRCVAAEVLVIESPRAQEALANAARSEMALAVPNSAFDLAVDLPIDDVPAYEFPKESTSATARLLPSGRCKRKFDPGNFLAGA